MPDSYRSSLNDCNTLKSNFHIFQTFIKTLFQGWFVRGKCYIHKVVYITLITHPYTMQLILLSSVLHSPSLCYHSLHECAGNMGVLCQRELADVACTERQKNVNHAYCNVILIVRNTWRHKWDHECEGWFAADLGVNVFSTTISGLVSYKVLYAYILCIVDCSQKFGSVLYHRADTISY